MSTPRRPARSGCIVAVALVGALALAGCGGSGGSGGGAAAATVPTTIDIADNPDGGSFRLLTYNVAGLPAEISKVHPDVDIPLISSRLNDDDVVVTQEDYDWWAPDGLAAGVDFVNYHGRLRAKVTHDYQSPMHPGPKAVGIDRPDLELGDGLGTLSRLPAGHDRRVAWTGCFGSFDQNDGGKADCLAMKGFQVTTLTLANGGTVYLYNVNAEAGSSAADQRLQAADFEQLAADIAAHAKGASVIVAGDTNLRLDPAHVESGHGQDGRIWKGFLKAAGLTDSCTVSGCKDIDAIDRVAYRSGAEVALDVVSAALRTDRFLDDHGDPLSDHDPLEVTFSWKPA